MSGRVACWFLVLNLVAGSATAVAEDHPTLAADVVTLDVRENKRPMPFVHPAPFLARELVRQAFFIAARDEWGLETCDAALREEPPNAPSLHVVPFELFCNVNRPLKAMDVCYTLSCRKGATIELLGDWKFRTDIYSPAMITTLADLTERMSRGKFKNLLQQQGLGKPVPAARDFAGVPRDTQERLWEWNEIAVLGAVRRIHAEIRAKGESPELLAGLAVGYANLGTLTEYYFSPADKAFSARALLYAERLVHQTDGSDWALWHRAYVRALTGLHEQARADIKTARKLWDKKSSKRPPFWADVLDAFCQGQLPKMLEKAKTRDERRLARYLNLQAVMYSGMTAVTIKASQSVLEECPDCLRAADALCSTAMIGPLSEVTGTSFPRFSKTLRSRLPDVHGFPSSLAKRLREAKPVEEAEKGVEDEVDFRVQLVADLKAETASGRDTLEPSLAVLGQVIEETQFAQVMRRLQLEGNVWAIPTEQTIANYRPLCAHHRYAAFIDSYLKDKSETDKAAQSLLQSIDPTQLGYGEAWILNWLRSRNSVIGTLWVSIANSHADPVFGDQMLGIDQGFAGSPDERTYNRPYMDSMWQTSSRLPAALAVQVQRNWRKAKFFSATVENDYADDPILMSALAHRYLQVKQLDAAERCAKQKIRAAPDYAAYETLAAIYKEKGDMTRWKETLEKSLDLPAASLEQAIIRNMIAQYHMDRKEWKEAVGYADAAAESYSAWSMLTAARCHEMLGEWEKSEALVRAVSERYTDSAMEWMLWCHRTGHGDANAADLCARNYFESLGTSFYPQTRERIAVYYLLKKEPEKALVIFKQCFAKEHSAYDAMHAATIADTLGRSEDRDALLSKIVDANPNQDSHGAASAGLFKRLVELLRKSLPPGSVKDLDFKKIDDVISGSPDNESPTNLQYFVGLFVKNRGDAEKAQEYLIRCAQSQLTHKYTHVLARQTLRDLKIPIPPSAVAESTESKK